MRDDGILDLDKLPALLTPEVKLFAFTHLSNSLGTINPVAQLCQKARAVGAITFVDGAQSAVAALIRICESLFRFCGSQTRQQTAKWPKRGASIKRSIGVIVRDS
jgi:selenocysteine lyase/cysteine desulfurase